MPFKLIHSDRLIGRRVKIPRVDCSFIVVRVIKPSATGDHGITTIQQVLRIVPGFLFLFKNSEKL